MNTLETTREDNFLSELAFTSNNRFPLNVIDLRGMLPTNENHAWNKRKLGVLKGLVVHQELGDGTIEQVADYHTGLGSHLRKGGVHSISYTLGIRDDGTICLLNNFEDITWSQGSKNHPYANTNHLSVMLQGNFNTDMDGKNDEPNGRQITSLMVLWTVLKNMSNWDDSCLFGHFDFGKKSCPGFTLETIIRAVRSNHKKNYDFTVTDDRQQALKDLGYKITVDGRWGKQSDKFLKRFQNFAGIIVDGVWGKQTEKAINNLLSLN